MLSPGGDLTVGFDPVDKLRAAILQGQSVSVVLIQLLKQPEVPRYITHISTEAMDRQKGTLLVFVYGIIFLFIQHRVGTFTCAANN